MKVFPGILLILTSVAFLLGINAVRAAGEIATAVGTVAPDFALKSQESTLVNLHDFRGHWIVLYFYPKDFTSGCTIEAHNFQRDIALYEQRNTVIVGVSMQDEDSHQKFCTKEGLHFKLLADTRHEVSSQYGSVMNLGVAKLSARHTFLINPEGKIERVWMDVNPTRHSQEVLAAITELQRAPAQK